MYDHLNMHHPDRRRPVHGRRWSVGAMGERMTREEEIKARSQRTAGIEYITPCSLDDIRYLLASNEELQRRVEKLEKALQFYARLDENMSYDEIEEDHGRRAVKALAKEQGDD